MKFQLSRRAVSSIMLGSLLAALPLIVLADEAAKPVQCDKGQTLTKALKTAQPGDTLVVTGICHERVTVTTDRITIDGQGSAIIDGGGGGPTEFSGVITLDGAKGVTLKRLTVRHSPGEGILGVGAAAFTVQGTTVQDNALTGIAVGDGSNANLIDTTMLGNGTGLDVYTSASAVLRGSVAMSQNLGNGFEINGQALVEIRGANVSANNNSGTGVVVGSGQLAIFGFAASTGSTLEASGNAFAGIIVGGSLFTVYPTATVTAHGNGVFGLLLGGPAFLQTLPGAGSKFVIENNGVGVRLQQGAGAQFQGGELTVTGNGVGLSADGAGTLTILSESATPSSVSGNGLDVDLKFGSRTTFEGVAIGTIVCDTTVLSRGTTVCP
jgi:hypothetical protein